MSRTRVLSKAEGLKNGQNLSEMVHVAVCAIAAGQPAAFTASFCCIEQGEERGEKSWGAEV